MTYVSPNFKSKAAIRRAIAAGEIVEVFEPGMGTAPTNGTCSIEGPHYPQPHVWYGRATVVNGRVTEVK